jgi:hypothetical protein
MAINTFTLPDVAKLVSKSIEKQLEECIYNEIRPITDRIVRNAAKQFAQQVKGFAEHRMGTNKNGCYHYDPSIVLVFNGENIKV